jgi:GrpB-like predicted nucleotidyltransferase (UPF0157 family)
VELAGGRRTHHLHVLAESSPHPDEYRLFRDYLRANEDAAREYSQLKRALAAKYANDRTRYVEEKSEFVSALMVRVRQWRG